MHGLAGLCLWLIPEQFSQLDWLWRLVLLVLVLVSCYRELGRHVSRRDPAAVVCISLISDADSKIVQRNGQETAVELLGSSTLTSVLVILVFKMSRWRRISCILPADSLDAEQFRQLRLRLTIS